jgi:hypothetical protein
MAWGSGISMKGWFVKGTGVGLAARGIMFLLTTLFLLTTPACNPDENAYDRLTSLEHEDRFRGLVIRNERVYPSPASGRILRHKGEEQRIKKDGKIMTIITRQHDEGFYEHLKSITRQIAAYERDNLVGTILKKDLDIIDRRILEEIDNLGTTNDSDNVKADDKALKKLEGLLEKKKELIDKINEKTPYMEQLYNKRSEMIKSLKQSFVDVFSPVSGIVSYCYDGLETVFSSRSLDHLTAEQLTELTPGENIEVDRATYGQPLFKIIDHHQWYVVTLKKFDKPPFFDKNQTIKMKIFQLDGKILDAKVYNIIKDKGYDIIVFSIDQQVKGYTKIRSIDFNIIVV